jgi:hypothetical protein
MNLVDTIKEQLSGAVIQQLSSLIGASEGATRSAALAAVPALLSGLSNMASSGTGSQKLISALGQLGGSSVENLAHKMSSQPSSALEQGASLLNSLFGGSTVSAIVNVLSRFASIAPGATQKLLGYLTPLVLGAITSRLGGKGVTSQALSSLFADQKASIASALPAGLSLADVPGFSTAAATARTAARGVEEASPAWMKWLLPLAGLAALLLLLWWWLPSSTTTPEPAPAPTLTVAPPPQPAKVLVPEASKIPAPDVTKLSTELTDTFKTLTETLTGVKDVASAEAALPRLQDLSSKLEDAKATVQKLGDAGKTTIKALVQPSQTKLKDLIDKVLAIPGVGDKIKTVIDAINAKLSDLAG